MNYKSITLTLTTFILCIQTSFGQENKCLIKLVKHAQIDKSQAAEIVNHFAKEFNDLPTNVGVREVESFGVMFHEADLSELHRQYKFNDEYMNLLNDHTLFIAKDFNPDSLDSLKVTAHLINLFVSLYNEAPEKTGKRIINFHGRDYVENTLNRRVTKNSSTNLAVLHKSKFLSYQAREAFRLPEGINEKEYCAQCINEFYSQYEEFPRASGQRMIKIDGRAYTENVLYLYHNVMKKELEYTNALERNTSKAIRLTLEENAEIYNLFVKIHGRRPVENSQVRVVEYKGITFLESAVFNRMNNHRKKDEFLIHVSEEAKKLLPKARGMAGRKKADKVEAPSTKVEIQMPKMIDPFSLMKRKK